MLTKDIAICIRAIDYSETSQIVTLFSRASGKIRAIAKGSKRAKSAFDGAIEVFSYGKIVLATLTEFEQAPAFAPAGDNLFALNCCLFATELLSNLTNDYDPHPELFDSFVEFLKNTNELQATRTENRDTLVLLILFQLALLKEAGLQPVLNSCVNCKTKFENQVSRIENQVYFSSSANGVICRDCEVSFPDRIRLTKDAGNCLNNLKMLAEANNRTLNEIEKVLVHHFTEVLGQPPKMAKHILESQKP